MGDFLPTNMNTLSVIGTTISIFGIMAESFHTIYDNKTLENMKRYYAIDTDNELVKYIRRNHLAELDGDILHIQKVNKKS
jgi:hypothetical protein